MATLRGSPTDRYDHHSHNTGYDDYGDDDGDVAAVHQPTATHIADHDDDDDDDDCNDDNECNDDNDCNDDNECNDDNDDCNDDDCNDDYNGDNLSDYDFSQFGQWDGDSASYYQEDDNYYPHPSHCSATRSTLTPPCAPSPEPLRLPSPLTPIVSPSAFTQEFVEGSSTSGVQYEYIITNIYGEPVTGLQSPLTHPGTPRPATPLEYEEEFNPEFDIRTQVAVGSTPCSPTPELVYPDPPSESTPVEAAPECPSSAPSCIPSRASVPPRVPTPDSPINYERVAEQSPPVPHIDLRDEQENIRLALPLFRPPSCLDHPEHPHVYTTVYTPEGESWRLASESIREYFYRIPRTPDLFGASYTFHSVTPFRIPPPHVYTILPRLIDPAIHPDFPPLYVCSKAVVDLPSVDLPLGSVRYNFREGLREVFGPLPNVIKAGYLDSLVTLEIQDFLDGRIITTYGHLRFSLNGQVFAFHQGYFFEDIIRSNPSLLSHCLTPRVPADPFSFVPVILDSVPL
ncbi:hypothetical protein EDB83DRAFT_2518590 [Lactarius deliciosus]|nr:hypothetical protein EDB83DRAFT_2518590 [Lactarius deliciosus]